MAKLTQELIHEYIASGGNHCPMCKSEDIESNGQFEVDDNTVYQNVKCNACGFVWHDIYTLTTIEVYNRWVKNVYH